MQIEDLGELAGPVLVFGGPYSNLQATEALITQVRAVDIPPQSVICTGDVVAYCADAGGCVDAVMEFGCATIAGNCERQLASGSTDCGCGFEVGSTCERLSTEWFPHAAREITQAHRDWMAALPDVITFRHCGRSFAVIHGGVNDVARFLWPVSPKQSFAEEVTALQNLIGPIDGVISGHCGMAFARDVAGVAWINAGVIGMPPHDGRPQTRYALLGDQGVVFERLSYDVEGAINAMQAAQLAEPYARALGTGLWPSEDILPPELRR